MLVVVGASNAVNLTDGLDGLAIGPIVMAGGAFAMIAYLTGNFRAADYLQHPQRPGRRRADGLLRGPDRRGASASSGSTAIRPQVFMGDVGSLALGGAIGTLAVLTKPSCCCRSSAASTWWRRPRSSSRSRSFKLTGKRVFQMAPLHHHYELNGLGGAQDHRPLLDRLLRAGAAGADDPQAALRRCGPMITLRGRGVIARGSRGDASDGRGWRRWPADVTVVGLAKSGVAAARLLRAAGAACSPPTSSPLEALGREAAARSRLGVRALDGRRRRARSQGAALVVVSPGVPLDSPAARRRRAPAGCPSSASSSWRGGRWKPTTSRSPAPTARPPPPR